MNKKAVIGMLMLVMLLASGCAKGEITLDLRKIGQADVACQVVVAPALAVPLEQIKERFRGDQFQVRDERDGDWVGFAAERHFDRVRDVKDIHLFRPARKPAEGAAAPVAEKAKPFQSEFVTEHGLFVDTYKVNAHLFLDQQLPLNNSNEKQLAAFLLSQVKVDFIVKLPVAATNSNAAEVRDEGRTLVWPINLTSDTYISAEAKLVNWPRVAGACLAVVLVAAVVWRKRAARAQRKGAA